jgi:hypothetical protein
MPAEEADNMRATIIFLLATTAIALGQAPSPMPIIVPAMTPATVVKTPAADNAAGSAQIVLKALLAMKTANEEILKQQAATLQKLDEIEKAAQEIRILTKRN